MSSNIDRLKIKIFADGADLDSMKKMNGNSWIRGLTTNPTLMRKSGVTDYKSFALKVLEFVKEKPISFEVFSDDLQEMARQAYEIASWGSNVFVKIPITNSKGELTTNLVKELTDAGVRVNVTAVMTLEQVTKISPILNPKIPSFVSIFAGRIADTGVDPIEIVTNSLSILSTNRFAEIIWASPRELLNVFQADKIGCHIITATSDILNKLPLVGKNLQEYSLETVQMFKRDADASGYTL